MTTRGTAPDGPGAAWGAAPFERVEHSIAGMHEALVDALAPAPGERVLDVACGTGGVALRAARTGAAVTGLDIAPALVRTARERADAEGLDVAWRVGDAQSLPFADGAFDVVVSSVGAIFAPDHGAVAGELARVTRPGGRLGLTAWTSEGAVAGFLHALAPFQPRPPASRPLEWGDRAYVARLLGDAFDLDVGERDVPHVDESAESMWELFLSGFGPLRALHDQLGPERREALRTAVVADNARYAGPDGRIHQPRTYLLVRGTRR